MIYATLYLQWTLQEDQLLGDLVEIDLSGIDQLTDAFFIFTSTHGVAKQFSSVKLLNLSGLNSPFQTNEFLIHVSNIVIFRMCIHHGSINFIHPAIVHRTQKRKNPYLFDSRLFRINITNNIQYDYDKRCVSMDVVCSQSARCFTSSISSDRKATLKQWRWKCRAVTCRSSPPFTASCLLAQYYVSTYLSLVSLGGGRSGRLVSNILVNFFLIICS